MDSGELAAVKREQDAASTSTVSSTSSSSPNDATTTTSTGGGSSTQLDAVKPKELVVNRYADPDAKIAAQKYYYTALSPAVISGVLTAGSIHPLAYSRFIVDTLQYYVHSPKPEFLRSLIRVFTVTSSIPGSRAIGVTQLQGSALPRTKACCM